MVVEAAVRARLGVAAGPDAQVDGIDRGTVDGSELSECRAEGFDIEATLNQGIIEAALAAAVCGLQAEVGQRRDRIGRQHGVAQLEEGIGTALEADMQGSAEGAQARQVRSGHGVQLARMASRWLTRPTAPPLRVKSQA